MLIIAGSAMICFKNCFGFFLFSVMFERTSAVLTPDEGKKKKLSHQLTNEIIFQHLSDELSSEIPFYVEQ